MTDATTRPRRTGGVRAPGWAGIVLAAVLIGAGCWGGWAELTVPGAVLAGVLAAAAPMTLGRSPLDVILDIPETDRRVQVGEIASCELRLRNHSTRRCLPFEVRLPVGADTHRQAVPSLAGGAEFRRLVKVGGRRRGVVRVGPVASFRGDPLGLMERTLSWTDAVDVYIHPPWVRLGADAPGTIRDLEGQTTRALSDRDISFHALRDYVPGDDVRNIHWLASARLPNLVVRQYEDTRRVHSVLVLATDAAEYPEEADFELAVSVFASLGRQQLEERRTVTPFAGQTLLRRESPDAFLDACCELAPAPGGAPAALAARAAVDSTPGATLAAIVTGPGASIDDIRKIPRLLPRDLRCLTVRCGGGLPFAGLRSGDASHGDLTDLADLPELFRLVAGP